ncbi:MAG: Lrp/AsnC family transcriptional regulator [Nanoarchaeota archaeon]|nr:Lrp/AsnC family transcriptional regulator [Nanoarchaeota archaeon]
MEQKSTKQVISLDSKDKKILEVLQKDARLPVSKIAKKVQMPADSVKYRIKRLEKLGVIKFYHAVLDFNLLGNPMYTYTLFSLFAMNEKNEKEFVSYLTNEPKITWVAKTSGKWDFVVGTCTKDFKEFDEIIKKIRIKFANSIKDYDQISTIDEYKWDMMYELIETSK